MTLLFVSLKGHMDSLSVSYNTDRLFHIVVSVMDYARIENVDIYAYSLLTVRPKLNN